MMSEITIQCPRCDQQIDGVPDGCRDPNCPREEIEAALEEAVDEVSWAKLRGHISDPDPMEGRGDPS